MSKNPRKKDNPGYAGTDNKKSSGKKSQRAAKPASKSANLTLATAEFAGAAPDMAAIEASATHAVQLARGEALATEGLFEIVAARSNRWSKPPVCYRQLSDGSWLMCLLQSDGSYAQCKAYTGPVSGDICG